MNSQTIEWQNTIGGLENEWLFSTELASDGNYILGGYSYSNISGDKNEVSRGANDFWIVKIDDNSGDLMWQKTIGGFSTDSATSTKETTDGGYIIGGYSSSYISGDKTENSRGADDYWVVKLDANRNIIWDKTFGGSGVDRLRSIIETEDGGFLMGGESDSNISGDKTQTSRGSSDMWIIKIDSNGIMEWQKTYGGNDIDNLKSIVKSNDGGYILAGSSLSNISGEKTENSRGLGDYWIIKINSQGNIIWQRTLGGNNGDYVEFIQPTSDGNYIIGGDAFSNISGEKTENSICNSVDAWIIKLDNNGQIIWDKTIGGASTEWIGNIRETNDNGFIIGAMSSSDISGYKTEASNGNRDYWVVKLDVFGNVEWEKTLGGSENDQLTSIVQANDGDYVFGGWSTSNISGDKTENSNGSFDYWMVKLNMNSSNYMPPSYSSITICEGNDLELNATSGAFYTWSGPNGFSSTEQNPTITNASILNSGTYNVTISDNALCVETKIINVTITPFLSINAIDDVYACDDNSDGFAIFNLEQIKSDIIGTLNNINITFYRENGQLIPDIELPAVQNLIANQESITVKVENSDFSCSNESVFDLIPILPIANILNDLTGCDDNNDGISEYFDTSTIETTVLGSQTGMLVSYFNSIGNLLPSPLPNPYTNTIANQETITVRVALDNNPNCFNEVPLKLIVSNLPTANTLNDLTGCDDNNDGISEYFDTSTIETTVLGNQTGMLVSYFDSNGNLLPSPLPNPYTNTIANQETITVRVALDNNPNCFNETSLKLIANSCYAPNAYFPRFFTPNNDGINDYWPKKTNTESITIYDRYGKLLKTLPQNSVGWNGTYNGKPLPTSDYWFVAIISKNKTIKGHFSLVR